MKQKPSLGCELHDMESLAGFSQKISQLFVKFLFKALKALYLNVSPPKLDK